MRVRLVSLAAILAVIGPIAPALAQAQMPVAPASSPQAEQLLAAPVSQLVAEVDIPWTRFQLDNGLTVIVHEDRKAPLVAISIWYNVGIKDEPEGSTGFVTEAKVLVKTAVSVPVPPSMRSAELPPIRNSFLN